MEISACIHICVSFPLLRNFCWDDLTWDQRGSMSHFVCKQDLTRFHSWQRTSHFYQSRSWNIRSLWSHPCFFISSAWMLSLCSSNIFLVSPVGDQTSPLCLFACFLLWFFSLKCDQSVAAKTWNSLSMMVISNMLSFLCCYTDCSGWESQPDAWNADAADHTERLPLCMKIRLWFTTTKSESEEFSNVCLFRQHICCLKKITINIQCEAKISTLLGNSDCVLASS